MKKLLLVSLTSFFVIVVSCNLSFANSSSSNSSSSSSSYSTTSSEKNKYKNVIQKIEDKIKELEKPHFNIKKMEP
jgi:peptidoglycan hydrolase CwlO-like protein